MERDRVLWNTSEGYVAYHAPPSGAAHDIPLRVIDLPVGTRRVRKTKRVSNLMGCRREWRVNRVDESVSVGFRAAVNRQRGLSPDRTAPKALIEEHVDADVRRKKDVRISRGSAVLNQVAVPIAIRRGLVGNVVRARGRDSVTHVSAELLPPRSTAPNDSSRQ